MWFFRRELRISITNYNSYELLSQSLYQPNHSVVSRTGYVLECCFAAWMLLFHSHMGEADVPCYSGKDKKYLLMEVTKLVLLSTQGENCSGMDPSLRFAAQLAFFPQWSVLSQKLRPQWGEVMLKEAKSQPCGQERQRWDHPMINRKSVKKQMWSSCRVSRGLPGIKLC